MTAPGLPDAVTVEIEWVPGSDTWDDVTANIAWANGITMAAGRTSWFDDLQPSTLTFALWNDGGDYTPDNPLGGHYPNVARGRRVRVSLTYSAIVYWLYRGWINDPSADSLEQGRAQVSFSCYDALGVMAQRTLATAWEQEWRARATTETADVIPFDDAPAARTFQNIGSGDATAILVDSARGLGSATIAETDQTVMLPGQVNLTASNGYGPIVAVDLGRGLGNSAVLELFVRSGQECTATSGDYVLAEGLDVNGIPVWSVRLTWNGTTSVTDLDIFDYQHSTYVQWLAGVGGNDQWYGISGYDTGLVSGSVFYVNNEHVLAYPYKIASTRYLVAGGRLTSWLVRGKQTNCPDSMSIAGIAAAGNNTSDLIDRARPLVTTASTDRITEIVETYCGLTMATITGTTDPQVTRANTSSVKAFDELVPAVLTAGANLWHEPSTDQIKLVLSDTCRSTTSTFTVDLGADDDASVQLRWVGPGGVRPTRVTASSAFGSATVRDPYAEDILGLRAEETFDTRADSVLATEAIAGWRLNRATAARIPQLAIDAVHAANNLYASLLAMRGGDRITITSLPSTQVGITQIDVYVLGWTLTITDTSIQWILDLQPADLPAEIILNDASYGRACAGHQDDGTPNMTATAGTISGTSAGTLVVTTASGPTLSIAAGDYPCNFGWLGECVTVNSPPAGSTSPQTVTVNARGVNGTVARTHGTGEAFDVWLTPALAAI